ncbi:MAG: ATP-grasp domain-containing protein [Anaerolineales bacterium]|nr:ATP-grasp domain-containing protein [Anaerolineales bacterium]
MKIFSPQKVRKTSVLVLDGDLRHAVDIVRSLGRSMNVTILSKNYHVPARYSRFLDSSIVHFIDRGNLEQEVDYLEELIQKRAFDVIISAGLDGNRVLSYGKERIKKLAKVPVPSFECFDIAEDKAKTILLAQSIGVSVPTSYFPLSQDNLLHSFSNIKFPVVVKARGGQGHYGFANNLEQLQSIYARICNEVPDQIKENAWPIIQEYIPGKIHGFYALMNQGELRACFMHERIHEVPPSGGPSSLAKNYYDEDLVKQGTAILNALKWHGVAMVEFKKDERDGEYKLLEINPKFWGSLGISIAAGVDFPYILVKMALEGDIDVVNSTPEKNILYQWLSMDMAHSWAVGKPWLWLGPVLRGVANDFLFSDPLPTFVLIFRGIKDVLNGRRRIHNLS